MPSHLGRDLYLTMREGALFQAVRDIWRGYADFQVVKFMQRSWAGLTAEQAEQIIALAHSGINAAGKIANADHTQQVERGTIPRLPR